MRFFCNSRVGLYALAMSLLGSGVCDWPAHAQDAQSEGRAQLILSNLPPKKSQAYKDLLALAGKDVNGQVLGFTKSEMWSMPSSRIESVVRKGETLGVTMVRLASDWNQILKSQTAPSALSGAQEAVIKNFEGTKEATGVGMMASPSAAVVEYALMQDYDPKSAIGVRPAALISKITIPLNDKERITVRRTSVDMRHEGCTWRGEIEGTGEPAMIIWWKSGKFTGMFTYRGHMYTLLNMGGELHAVLETDPGRMPPDHASMRQPGTTQAPSVDLKDDPLVARGEGAVLRRQDRSISSDRQDALGHVVSPTDALPPKIVPISVAKRRMLAAKRITIDLMVLYTSKVASKYIDVDADLVHLAVEQANQSFTNSGLGNIKLRVVHQQAVEYDESAGEHFNHLYRMVDGVGPFAIVRPLRDEKRADIVALIVDDPSGCGLSTRVGADAEEAFIVVHHSCAALTYSVAHEVGHIIGTRHDISLDNSVTPFPYGHGYVNGTTWRDVMSYKQSCGGCPRVPIWSNPTIEYRGQRAGTPYADNARVILEQAERVSKFR
jgi:hypothetical protein